MIELGISHYRPEQRQEAPFTDAVVSAIQAAAGASVQGDPSAIGALEVAAGCWARGFATARVSPDNLVTRAVTPAVLALIGRQLCRRGECVLALEVDQGRLILVPAASWDVRGGHRERDWRYRVDLFGASEHVTRLVRGSGVIHPRYAVDPATPWAGVSPLAWARLTGTLAGNLELRLGEEAGASVGAVMPLPQEGNLDRLRADLKAGKGRLVTAETTASGWGEGKGAAPQSDWKQQRFGADPPEGLMNLRSQAALTVLGACGVPPSLAMIPSDGAGQREGWRRFMHGTLVAVSDIVTAELREKLEVPDLELSFDRLFASDLAGRARAFQSMVGAGMEPGKAAGLAGLMEE